MKYIYQAIFKPESDGDYLVEFPVQNAIMCECGIKP